MWVNAFVKLARDKAKHRRKEEKMAHGMIKPKTPPCVECKWYEKEYPRFSPYCQHPATAEYDSVSGEERQRPCWVVRTFNNRECEYFEPRK